MRTVKFFAMICLIGLMAGCGGSDGDTPRKTVNLESDMARSSYAVGYNFGTNIRRIAGELELDAMIAGARDAYMQQDPSLKPEEIQTLLQEFQKNVYQLDQARRQESSMKNIAEGDAYRKENAKKPGVTVTKSGLQYNVIKAGNGATPRPSDKVRVHYHGMLIDGTVFDSSVDRGEPIAFRLDGLIPGWIEGLQLMKTGAKYRFVIPPELAYGKRGSGPKIGPDATLVFEVELLAIEK